MHHRFARIALAYLLCAGGLSWADGNFTETEQCFGANSSLGDADLHGTWDYRLSDYRAVVNSIKAEQARWAARGIYSDEHLPFLEVNEEKAERAIVLIHGISESPAGMRHIAQMYKKKGFNVISVLLEGHATVPEAMNRDLEATWQDQIDHAVAQAAGLGQKVMVGGYSYGGMLAYDAMHRLGPDKVQGLVLNGPIFEYDAEVATKVRARLAAGLPYTQDVYEGVEPPPPMKGYNYSLTTNQAYVNMLDSVDRIRTRWENTPLPVPTYVVYSQNDKVAMPEGVDRFIDKHKIDRKNNVVAIPVARHDDVVRPSKQQKFPEAAVLDLMGRMLAP